MLTKREEHSPASMCTGGSRHSPRACEAAQQHQPHRASHPWNAPSDASLHHLLCLVDAKMILEVKTRPLCVTLAVPRIFQSFHKHKCQSQFYSWVLILVTLSPAPQCLQRWGEVWPWVPGRDPSSLSQLGQHVRQAQPHRLLEIRKH